MLQGAGRGFRGGRLVGVGRLIVWIDVIWGRASCLQGRVICVALVRLFLLRGDPIVALVGTLVGTLWQTQRLTERNFSL